MGINLIRKPSETPNINNYDDYRLLRYATGGYNGVIKNYRNECDYEVSGLDFKIKSGEIVIDGVQSEIDSNGFLLNIELITGTEYYVVYCEVNMSLIDNQKSKIKSIKNSSAYPIVNKGDDLTNNQSGIARLNLYQFKVTNGVISDVVKLFNLVEYGNCKKINGVDSTEIFENDKKTVKQATNAINSINKNDGTFGKLEIDSNGILKYGDIIIPQKKVLWSGNLDIFSNSADSVIDLSNSVSIGNTIQLIYKNNDNSTLYTHRFIVEEYDSYIDEYKYYRPAHISYKTVDNTGINFTNEGVNYVFMSSTKIKLSFSSIGVLNSLKNNDPLIQSMIISSKITLKEISKIIE